MEIHREKILLSTAKICLRDMLRIILKIGVYYCSVVCSISEVKLIGPIRPLLTDET